jgi:putative SOS response-associated peptidase YedK
MRWGLIPFWAKNAKMGLSTINAKAETVATAPAFREAFKARRCLVPADAFYEWQKIDAKTKQPFAIGMKDGSPYAFAGLWERWKDPATREGLETFTVITTDPNEVIEPMHNRMPVIIQPKDYDRWLTPGDPERPPVDLLRPFPAEQMAAWKVDRKVGSVKNDTPATDRGACTHSRLSSLLSSRPDGERSGGIRTLPATVASAVTSAAVRMTSAVAWTCREV